LDECARIDEDAGNREAAAFFTRGGQAGTRFGDSGRKGSGRMQWNPISREVEQVFFLPVLTRTLPPHQHTNSFLLGFRNMGMVDAGQWDGQVMEGLAHFLGQVPGRKLGKIFLTHWHPDHCVGVENVKRETGCEVGAPVYEGERLDLSLIDFTFRDGDRFTLDELELEVIHTPGHSSGHCCFFLRAQGVLFTGDHILGTGTSIIVPPDGDMTLYMESLRRLLALPVKVICPGHGPLVWEPRDKIEEYLRHRGERERKLLEGIREGVCRPEEMVRRVYTDVPEWFHGMAYYTVLAHLEKLEREGKIAKRGDGEHYDPV
jgi:glyoxylase-like metal-dependent hydrolase (beta-lactamase superfamily II)